MEVLLVLVLCLNVRIKLLIRVDVLYPWSGAWDVGHAESSFV